jgi:hypothetical protein
MATFCLRHSPATKELLDFASPRFPPPWSVEDIGAAFVAKDSAGQKLAYVYFEDEPGPWQERRFVTI